MANNRRVLSTDEKETLESIVDIRGVSAVVSALAEIMRDKAAHLQAMWQDESSAREWYQGGRLLDRASEDLEDL